MKEKEIIQKVIDLIGNIDDVTVISAFNYSEERTPNMVVVGIDKVEQMNVGLPDYRYFLSITIDSFIEDDPDGALPRVQVRQGLGRGRQAQLHQGRGR